MKVRLVSYLLKFFNWSLNCHDSRNVNFFIHINSNVIDTNLLVFPLFLPRSHNVVAYEKFITYLFWTRRLYLINIELSKHCHLFPWYIFKKAHCFVKGFVMFPMETGYYSSVWCKTTIHHRVAAVFIRLVYQRHLKNYFCCLLYVKTWTRVMTFPFIILCNGF